MCFIVDLTSREVMKARSPSARALSVSVLAAVILTQQSSSPVALPSNSGLDNVAQPELLLWLLRSLQSVPEADPLQVTSLVLGALPGSRTDLSDQPDGRSSIRLRLIFGPGGSAHVPVLPFSQTFLFNTILHLLPPRSVLLLLLLSPGSQLIFPVLTPQQCRSVAAQWEDPSGLNVFIKSLTAARWRLLLSQQRSLRLCQQDDEECAASSSSSCCCLVIDCH